MAAEQLHIRINSLACRLKAAQRELSMFRSGEAYAKLRADCESLLRERDAETDRLRKERDAFSFSRREITRQWTEVLEDMQKEHVKEVQKLKKAVAELPDMAASLKNLIHDHEACFYSYGSDHQECLVHIERYLKDSMENEKNLAWSRQMLGLVREIIHENNLSPEGVAEEKMSEFEARYDAIVQTAAKEYEDESPSDYYRDGYNLYLRIVKYKHNHLLFLSNPLVEPDNNLCERKARILKGKINQAISLRSFENLTCFCECLSVLTSRQAARITCTKP